MMIGIVMYIFINHNGMIDGPDDEAFTVGTPRQVNDTIGTGCGTDDFDRYVGFFLYVSMGPIIRVRWTIVRTAVPTNTTAGYTPNNDRSGITGGDEMLSIGTERHNIDRSFVSCQAT